MVGEEVRVVKVLIMGVMTGLEKGWEGTVVAVVGTVMALAISHATLWVKW